MAKKIPGLGNASTEPRRSHAHDAKITLGLMTAPLLIVCWFMRSQIAAFMMSYGWLPVLFMVCGLMVAGLLLVGLLTGNRQAVSTQMRPH